ncbi:hypothetical protein H4Q26_013686 [Puccinia striiformis f. sp. tritici PST-130]|nr:hypothetical protein H4Q26_013686 [Puccinia striiformis f. sp. tritici PST-130]
MREINKFNLANVLYDHDLQLIVCPPLCLLHQSQGKDGVHSKNPQKGSDLKHENLRKLKLKVLACVIASAAQWAWRIVTTNSIV